MERWSLGKCLAQKESMFFNEPSNKVYVLLTSANELQFPLLQNSKLL